MANTSSRVPIARQQAGYLSRGQVAERLGVSLRTVKRFEADGHLRPILEKGVHVFAPEDISRLETERFVRAAAAKRGRPTVVEALSAGELASRAFALFDQGGGVREAVRVLRTVPETAAHLYRQWQAGNAASVCREAEEDDDEGDAKSDARWRTELDRTIQEFERDLATKWGRKPSQ